MSEPIQAISQGNYILHNIDSKKLYVQEPLFTANSGDAVYVGWRPDETVLYSGDAGTTITLSESPLNFNKLKIISRAYINSNLSANFGAGSVNEYVVSPNLKCVIVNGYFAGTSGTTDDIYEYYTKWTGCDTTAWTRSYYKFKNITASSLGNAGNWASPYIIYGINRKENA